MWSWKLQAPAVPTTMPAGPHTAPRHTSDLIFFFSLQLLEFDKELSVFKDRLYELDISFPPR